MNEKTVKRPLIKAVFFALIPTFFAIIAGVIISIMELDYNFSVIIQSICFMISIIIGMIIIKIFHWKFSKIGICKIEKNTLKNVLYFLPLIIASSITLFLGFNDENNLLRIILLIIFTFIVGVNEELYFRGIILSLFKIDKIRAIIISSLLFGIVHSANAFVHTNYLYVVLQVIYSFIIGIVFAETVTLTGSIIPAILIHTLHNFITFITENSVEGFALVILTIQTIILIFYAVIMWKIIKIKNSMYDKYLTIS